jgi:hypothetical protein
LITIGASRPRWGDSFIVCKGSVRGPSAVRTLRSGSAASP